ncbi:hypothetical protein EC991_010653, partial [Linnemannia zychae]
MSSTVSRQLREGRVLTEPGGVDEVDQVDQVDQQVVQAELETKSALATPVLVLPVETELAPVLVQATPQLVPAVTDPKSLGSQPIVTSDPRNSGGDIELAAMTLFATRPLSTRSLSTRPLATRTAGYLSLDLPTTVSPPILTPATQPSPACTAKDLVQAAVYVSCTPTEIALASSRGDIMSSCPHPRLRQDQLMTVPGSSTIPQVARSLAYINSPGYVVPHK